MKLAVKLILVCVSRRFRTSSLKACGQWRWIEFSRPFTLSAVWFPFYDSVGSWMTVNCSLIVWFVHPTQHSSLWCQFFVCRDRGKKQFYQFKVPVHKKTSEHLLLSVSQFFGEESSTVTVDWNVYFLYFSSNYFVDTLSERKGENASILYNIALDVTLVICLI